MREGSRCACILERADAVVARASHGRRDLCQEQRGDNDWIPGFLYCREDRQALRMPFFVRIERVHEDTRVDGVPRTLNWLLSNPTPRGRSSDRHLPSHHRQEAYAADRRLKALFEASSSSQKLVPRGPSGRIFACRRLILARSDRKNYTDGPATMCQKVGRVRLPYVTDDAGGMSFQLTDADDVLDPAYPPGSVDVVSHVTTLCAHLYSDASSSQSTVSPSDHKREFTTLHRRLNRSPHLPSVRRAVFSSFQNHQRRIGFSRVAGESHQMRITGEGK